MSLPLNPSDNYTTPAPATTVGFKLSKPGYDAKTTAGANLIFDSSWPSLPIVLETTVPNTITGYSSPNMVIPHNLGFPPFAMGWNYGPDPNGSNPGSGSYGTRFICMADAHNIYINARLGFNPFYGDTTATKIRILVFNLDLSTDIDYTLAPGSTYNQPYDSSFGVKIVKPGKSITSTDMRDFALHSRCQSPLIQAVKTQATVNPANANIVSYTNSGKSPVWVYGFIIAGGASNYGSAYYMNVPNGTYVPAPYYSQDYPRVFTDGFKSYLAWTPDSSPGAGDGDLGATLLILRDPMFAAQQTTVVF